MSLKVLDGPTITKGQSLSDDGVDCSEGQIVRVTVPQEFTEANLTFQVSSDGNLYNDLYDAQGDEITLVRQAGHHHRGAAELGAVDRLHQVPLRHA